MHGCRYCTIPGTPGLALSALGLVALNQDFQVTCLKKAKKYFDPLHLQATFAIFDYCSSSVYSLKFMAIGFSANIILWRDEIWNLAQTKI